MIDVQDLTINRINNALLALNTGLDDLEMVTGSLLESLETLGSAEALQRGMELYEQLSNLWLDVPVDFQDFLNSLDKEEVA